jgi:hypothetical protein
MCFLLYVGTTAPLPLRKWEKDASGPSVESLTERDSPIKQHFGKPTVQYVGSTSRCGCDYPHATFQVGGWPEINYKAVEKDDIEIARDQIHHENCEALISLLRSSGEEMIELYGVWDGDFSEPPEVLENISIESLRANEFCFKERGFYRVQLKQPSGT